MSVKYNTGLEIVENQKENMVGRKKLAEQTRGAPRVFNICWWCAESRRQTSRRLPKRRRPTHSRDCSKVRGQSDVVLLTLDV